MIRQVESLLNRPGNCALVFLRCPEVHTSDRSNALQIGRFLTRKFDDQIVAEDSFGGLVSLFGFVAAPPP